MELKSSAFQDNQDIPRKYTGDGADVSPPLVWNDLPDGAKACALICDDAEAPRYETATPRRTLPASRGDFLGSEFPPQVA